MIKVWLQYLLPHRLLSRIIYRATRWRWRPWKNALIRLVVRIYHVNMDEAGNSDPRAYPDFNAFFTRRLRVDARPLGPAGNAIISPSDGRISQAGAVEAGRIFQAKRHRFSVAELLGDAAAATPYRDGHFVTIYLSPRDYHRVHMPLAGTLQRSVHIPGRIFSVAPFAVRGIPRLFARNERLVCHFQGTQGPFVVVMVGAMLVSSITTAWDGLVIPPHARRLQATDQAQRHIALAQGDEMGHFNMGSTVIVLVPPGARLNAPAAGRPVYAGQSLGRWTGETA